MRTRYPKFKTILIDPPWQERGGGKVVRGAQKHYPLMNPEEILETIQNSGVWNPDMANGCHLYMWVTNNWLFKGGAWLLEQLDFEYITNLVWTKNRMGLGYYFRGRHELCLFARPRQARGYSILPSLVRTEDTLIKADDTSIRVHSRKPQDLYRKIEAVSPGPRLEMFARQEREGWISWGNDLLKVSNVREARSVPIM